jgi:hypothetical protein
MKGRMFSQNAQIHCCDSRADLLERRQPGKSGELRGELQDCTRSICGLYPNV